MRIGERSKTMTTISSPTVAGQKVRLLFSKSLQPLETSQQARSRLTICTTSEARTTTQTIVRLASKRLSVVPTNAMAEATSNPAARPTTHGTTREESSKLWRREPMAMYMSTSVTLTHAMNITVHSVELSTLAEMKRLTTCTRIIRLSGTRMMSQPMVGRLLLKPPIHGRLM